MAPRSELCGTSNRSVVRSNTPSARRGKSCRHQRRMAEASCARALREANQVVIHILCHRCVPILLCQDRADA